MADSEEFLKKVYDKYLGSDYEWGDSDLNPKREIKKSSDEEWEQEQAEIIATVEARLKELSALASKMPKYKKPEVVNNDNFLTTTGGVNGAPSPSNSLSESQMIAQAALGGDIGDNLFLPKGNFDDQVDFMLNMVIPQLTGILIQGPYPYTTVPGTIDSQTELYNPGCDDEDTASDEYESSNPEFNKLKERLLAENGDDDSDTDDSDDDDSGTGSSGAAADQADKETDDALAAADARIALRDKETAKCIAQELGILSSILALLKVINALKKVLLLMLSIVVPIVKMIAFAAQCWINPPAAGEVIQMAAEKIAALLMSLIGEIIQMIWDMLDMDCKTEQLQEVLDQINDVLSGVDSLVNSTKNLVSFGLKQYSANKKSLKDSYDKFKQTEQWSKLKEELTSKEQWEKKGELLKDTLSDSLFGEDGVSGAGAMNLLSAAMPSGIKSALNGLMDSAKNIVSTAKDIASEIPGLQDDAQLKNTLIAATEFLGPIRIK